MGNPDNVTIRVGEGSQRASLVDHPAHYGGADNPYEAIKVIEAWNLGFNLGNALKYICRRGQKAAAVAGVPPRELVAAARVDLEKAAFYLQREIEKLKALEARP